MHRLICDTNKFVRDTFSSPSPDRPSSVIDLMVGAATKWESDLMQRYWSTKTLPTFWEKLWLFAFSFTKKC